MKIPLSKIVIGERQRLDLGDVEALATSLAELGQINAITVAPNPDGTYSLITGRRRLAAATRLQWPDIEAKLHEEALSETQRQRIEYEEDVVRKDRTWQEKCIAVAKLFKLMKREKHAAGETWTVRSMESFTGISKTQIGYMLQVAEALTANPRDEEMWKTENYTDAVKLLVQRSYDATNSELEKRRAQFLAQVTKENAEKREKVEPSPSAVPEKDTTEEAAPVEKTRIYLRGTHKQWGECIPDEDFMAGKALLLIARDILGARELTLIKQALADNGFAIIFIPTLDQWLSLRSLASDINLETMDEPFLWHRLEDKETVWPFQTSLEYGLVITKQPPSTVNKNAAQSFISATPSDENVAYSVVEHICSTLSFEAAPVFCIGSIDPVHIAMLGRVPIFFEGDEAKFLSHTEALRKHYEETVPDCEVVV